MTPRHATSSRLLQARIASRSGKAAWRAYVAFLLAAAVITGAWTMFALTSTGPS
jgi:hypothetical protein